MSTEANPLSTLGLTGQTDSHIETYPYGNVGVHREVMNSLEALRLAAESAGFNLQLCSGFRSFDSQLKIWNEKAQGKRPVLDLESRPLDIKRLSQKELLFAILRWSALPGMSRHHWGTDFDVYDLSRMPKSYQLRLVPEEFTGAGYFSELHHWLDTNMSQFGFFRPYVTDRGGISPERWHLSYAPLAQVFWAQCTTDLFLSAISNAKIELYSEIKGALPEIFDRYFKQIDPPQSS